MATEELVKTHSLKYSRVARVTDNPLCYNGSSECDQISADKLYLVYIDNGWLDSGGWYTGSFSRQHYGWNFWPWGSSGIQLSGIWLVYEIVSGLPTEGHHHHQSASAAVMILAITSIITASAVTANLTAPGREL